MTKDEGKKSIPYTECEECQRIYQEVYELQVKLARLEALRDRLWYEHGHN